MEILLVLVAMGVAAFYFFRGNTRRGAEMLRAHVFLGKLERGGTLAEAKYLADNAVEIQSRFSTEDQRRDAMFIRLRCDTKYRGKTFPMIADAYQKGMTPNLSLWQEKTIMSSIQSPREAILSQVRPHTTPSQWKESGYEAYENIFKTALKRLRGIDDDPYIENVLRLGMVQQGYSEGSDPSALALSAFDMAERFETLNKASPGVVQKQSEEHAHDKHAGSDEPKVDIATSEKSERQSFETYQSVVLSEVKRLDGTSDDEIHWSEIYDDEGTKRAFEDGVDPKTLAAIIVKKGIPPPDPLMVSGWLENDSDFITLKHLAMQGDAIAQGKLGLVYLGGIGAPLNSGEAVKWLLLAADQGKAETQFVLGMLFLDGQLVAQDLVQAHFWISLAAVGFQAFDSDLSKNAVQQRENIAVKMTPEQIVEAQRLAQEWTATHPKK